MLTSLFSLGVCGLYYIGWIYVLPRIRNYRIRQEVVEMDNGAKSHRLVKVPVPELASWDATHDALGRIVGAETDHSSEEVQIKQA